MLTVHDFDSFGLDHAREKCAQLFVQSLVLEVISYVGDVGRRRPEFEDAEAVIARLAHARLAPNPGLYDDNTVAPFPQAFRQLERAPPAAAADRRKGVGGQEDIHESSNAER